MIFQNRMAVFLWGFAALFMLFVAAMTYVLIRDGAPAAYSLELMFGIMGIFWLAGFGLWTFAASKPCVRVSVRPDARVSVVWRYPFKTVAREFAGGDIKPAGVVESRDDEGAPYFHARTELADGTAIDLAESHDRDRCESACMRFNDALAAIQRR